MSGRIETNRQTRPFNLRILIICGSLEPGRNGVGDFCRRLADAFQEEGVDCEVISVFDPYVERDTCLTEVSHSGSRIRRFGSASGNRMQAEVEKTIIEEEYDGWILNYVPYSYHPKGFAYKLRHVLAPLSHKKGIVMMHELWLGAAKHYGLKERIVGTIQRACFSYATRDCSNVQIMTHVPAYAAYLSSTIAPTVTTPIFSNVRVHRRERDESREWLYSKIGFTADADELLIGTFGNIHPGSLQKGWIEAIESHFAQGRRLRVFSAGHLAQPSLDYWRRMSYYSGEGRTFHRLGPLDNTEVSLYLSALDYGFSSTPSELINKSGSVAAMLAASLPILLPAPNWELRGIDTPDHDLGGRFLRFSARDGRFKEFIRPAREVSPRSVACNFTAQFLAHRAHLL